MNSALTISALTKWSGPKLDISDATTHIPWLNAMEAAISVTTTTGVSYRDVLYGTISPINSSNNNNNVQYKQCKQISINDDPLSGQERKCACTRGNDILKITSEPLSFNQSKKPKCIICQQDVEIIQITEEERKRSQDVISVQALLWTKLIDSMSVRDQASFQLVPHTQVSTIWNTIKLRLHNATTSNATTLFEEFSNLKLGPNEDAISFINRVGEKKHQLNSIGEAISSNQCKAQLLKGLRDKPEFKSFIDIWKSNDSANKSYEDSINYFVTTQQYISSEKHYNDNYANSVQHSNTPICRNFASTGKCRFGAHCKFLHQSAKENPSPSSNHTKSKSKEICRNFLNGHCNYGDKCYRLHPAKETNKNVNQIPANTDNSSTNQADNDFGI
jgi:hypothetical protein